MMNIVTKWLWLHISIYIYIYSILWTCNGDTKIWIESLRGHRSHAFVMGHFASHDISFCVHICSGFLQRVLVILKFLEIVGPPIDKSWSVVAQRLSVAMVLCDLFLDQVVGWKELRGPLNKRCSACPHNDICPPKRSKKTCNRGRYVHFPEKTDDETHFQT